MSAIFVAKDDNNKKVAIDCDFFIHEFKRLFQELNFR